MLEELYGHMSGLQSFEKETLLDEEPEIMQRRAAVKQVLHPLKRVFPLGYTTFLLHESSMVTVDSTFKSIFKAAVECLRSAKPAYFIIIARSAQSNKKEMPYQR